MDNLAPTSSNSHCLWFSETGHFRLFFSGAKTTYFSSLEKYVEDESGRMKKRLSIWKISYQWNCELAVTIVAEDGLATSLCQRPSKVRRNGYALNKNQKII